MTAQIILVLAVAAVGVLHTIVPDHWVPIALVARQCGWTRAQTARAALGAGAGHVASTLAIGVAVWIAGVAFATRFGTATSIVSSVALIGFGLWIAVGSILDQRRESPHGGHDSGSADPNCDPADAFAARAHSHRQMHRHEHRHAGGLVHAHLHAHAPDDAHDIEPATEPPLHEHEHKPSGRTALLLILGSSPMVEGIPAFFAAARYGVGLIAIMALVFAAATVVTYVALCVYSADRLRGISIGPFERYGEVLSGAFIALVGVAFLIWPVR